MERERRHFDPLDAALIKHLHAFFSQEVPMDPGLELVPDHLALLSIAYGECVAL